MLDEFSLFARRNAANRTPQMMNEQETLYLPALGSINDHIPRSTAKRAQNDEIDLHVSKTLGEGEE